MSAPRPLEQAILAAANKTLGTFSADAADALEGRLQALEAASSRIGGFDLSEYHRLFEISPVASKKSLTEIGERLVGDIQYSGIPPTLALSALAREEIEISAKRNTGAYHTDFRLALHLAAEALNGRRSPSRLMDTACGTGILLAALVHLACGSDRKKATEWIHNRIYGADLSAVSLRGARLSLAAFTSEMEAIETMATRLKAQDSLMVDAAVWHSMAPGGFDLVIGNPPWEKVKTTRHEFLRASGENRHYGAEYGDFDRNAYDLAQRASGNYAFELGNRFVHARGEIDLYVAFLELSINITSGTGRTAMLVPAGLIRSQRSEALRKFVFESSSDVSVTVLDNRARFFAIDTRFKFLALISNKNTSSKKDRRSALLLKHGKGTDDGVDEICRAAIGRESLRRVRPDLSIPEVRGPREWSLFLKMSRNGIFWDALDSRLKAEIVREVDMTRERKHFRSPTEGIPVVEGRMVQQHRFGAKQYSHGTGRSAIWDPLPIGQSAVKPQYAIEQTNLSAKVRDRIKQLRVGFCDITGQTNERSMMAALIPDGVVCGNKVPTITFPGEPTLERLLLWIGIVNSLPFDWLLRQVVTTTINYFVLLGVPFPNIEKDSLPGRSIIDAARRLRQIDMGIAPASAVEVGELRAKIDIIVATAYGASFEEIEIMLSNFPLLDRGQPPLPGEVESTVTKDLIRLAAAKRFRRAKKVFEHRVSVALSRGAFPYVPAEHSAAIDEIEIHAGI